MKKPTLIFVHGGQGCGKSTVTNQLREKQLHSTLMRLAGVPKQEKANEKALIYHLNLLKSLKAMVGTGMNFIFDRSFLCEKVYSNLGFKQHDFVEESEILKQYLIELSSDYDIYFVLLTAGKEVLDQRLKREGKPNFEEVNFDSHNSLNQQEEYRREFNHLPAVVKRKVFCTNNRSSEEITEQILHSIEEV